MNTLHIFLIIYCFMCRLRSIKNTFHTKSRIETRDYSFSAEKEAQILVVPENPSEIAWYRRKPWFIYPRNLVWRMGNFVNSSGFSVGTSLQFSLYIYYLADWNIRGGWTTLTPSCWVQEVFTPILHAACQVQASYGFKEVSFFKFFVNCRPA